MNQSRRDFIAGTVGSLAVASAFAGPPGIEIYFYDQLGCGFSERPDDERLWNLPMNRITTERDCTR